MLNKDGQRELAYVVAIDEICPIKGYDRVEYARVGGWWVIVRKDQFKVGDLAIYIEVDSKVPEQEPFMFLEKRNFKVKTLKMCKVISQGLLMSPEDFGWFANIDNTLIIDGDKDEGLKIGDFLTEKLGITYADAADNKRKANSEDKYKKMAQRNGKLFSKQPFRWLMKRDWGKKVLFVFFGRKKDKKNGWPVGQFPGVSKTDQERCENMPWILSDKTPHIVTQKCDGSSGTYILEKKGRKYEFYVCSRNVRMMSEDQECFYGKHNYYWEVALKYDIENKMKEWLNNTPGATWVCWQGEICAPDIQKNPHKLKETHFYCFHWTDNINGRLDIVTADKIWKQYNMEVVPIIDTNYILPDDFEEFKLSADGKYDAIVCEGAQDCDREGFVYYKTTDPTYSFKNVSRTYLLNH
jgi:hypothetical protein